MDWGSVVVPCWTCWFKNPWLRHLGAAWLWIFQEGTPTPTQGEDFQVKIWEWAVILPSQGPEGVWLIKSFLSDGFVSSLQYPCQRIPYQKRRALTFALHGTVLINCRENLAPKFCRPNRFGWSWWQILGGSAGCPVCYSRGNSALKV